MKDDKYNLWFPSGLGFIINSHVHLDCHLIFPVKGLSFCLYAEHKLFAVFFADYWNDSGWNVSCAKIENRLLSSNFVVQICNFATDKQSQTLKTHSVKMVNDPCSFYARVHVWFFWCLYNRFQQGGWAPPRFQFAFPEGCHKAEHSTAQGWGSKLQHHCSSASATTQRCSLPQHKDCIARADPLLHILCLTGVSMEKPCSRGSQGSASCC